MSKLLENLKNRGYVPWPKGWLEDKSGTECHYTNLVQQELRVAARGNFESEVKEPNMSVEEHM